MNAVNNYDSQEEQGKAILGPSYNPEHGPFGTYDNPYDLAYTRYTLEAASAAAGILDVERRIVGRAVAGETLTFSLPLCARPVVLCAGGLEAKPDDTTEASVTFSGRGAGTYEIVGE